MLRDQLSGPERDELRNVMRNEPVFGGDTISHQTAQSLNDKGLIERDAHNRWVACWEQIKSGVILPRLLAVCLMCSTALAGEPALPLLSTNVVKTNKLVWSWVDKTQWAVYWATNLEQTRFANTNGNVTISYDPGWRWRYDCGTNTFYVLPTNHSPAWATLVAINTNGIESDYAPTIALWQPVTWFTYYYSQSSSTLSNFTRDGQPFLRLTNLASEQPPRRFTRIEQVTTTNAVP